MTIVTITENEIRAYHHAGKTGICIAVSAVLQTAARILHAGKALDAVEMTEEPPLYAIHAAIGEFLGGDFSLEEKARVARERAGRRAFVRAVFDGVATTLEEIARLNGADAQVLDVKDQRTTLASRG